MVLNALAGPLQRSPSVSTRDPDEMGHILRTVYGATMYDAGSAEGFLGKKNFVQFQNISLGFCAYDSQVRMGFPEADFARQQIALKGHATTRAGRQTVDVHKLQSCVTSPGHSVHFDFEGGFEQLFLRVSKQSLTEKLGALLGAMPNAPIEFEPISRLDTPDVQNLLQLVSFLAQILESRSSVLSPLVQAELEQAVLVAFLCVRTGTTSAACWSSVTKTFRRGRCGKSRSTSRRIGISRSTLKG